MKIVYIENSGYYTTLTTWLYCCFDAMSVAEKMGVTPYISWPQESCLHAYNDHKKFATNPNMYEWYFEQPFISSPGDRKHFEIWDRELPKWGANVHPNFTSQGIVNQPLEEIKRYFKKRLIFNSETNTRGNALVSKYNIDFSKTIGLTWRGTDGQLDGRPRFPIQVYFPFIDDILQENPDFRIMCTAEEERVLDPLLKRYPQAFTIQEFISSPYQSKDNPERHSPVSGYERGLQPALMVWLFSKCAYYIKNRSSTGGIASWISDGKIICLAHEENLSYDLTSFLDKAFINGKLVPLYR